MMTALPWLAGTVTLLGLLYMGLHRLIEWALPHVPPEYPITACQCGKYPVDEDTPAFLDRWGRHTAETCIPATPHPRDYIE